MSHSRGKTSIIRQECHNKSKNLILVVSQTEKTEVMGRSELLKK